MDLEKLSAAQLGELQQRIPAELKRRQAEEKAIVLNEIKVLAKSRGYSLEELLGKDAKGEKVVRAGKVAPKYRHPKDSGLEWTGRGRKPKWVEAWVAGGGKIEALAI